MSRRRSTRTTPTRAASTRSARPAAAPAPHPSQCSPRSRWFPPLAAGRRDRERRPRRRRPSGHRVAVGPLWPVSARTRRRRGGARGQALPAVCPLACPARCRPHSPPPVACRDASTSCLLWRLRWMWPCRRLVVLCWGLVEWAGQARSAVLSSWRRARPHRSATPRDSGRTIPPQALRRPAPRARWARARPIGWPLASGPGLGAHDQAWADPRRHPLGSRCAPALATSPAPGTPPQAVGGEGRPGRSASRPGSRLGPSTGATCRGEEQA
jgi:hypothetical protein